MIPILQTQSLLALLQERPVVLIDARSGPDARIQYELQHLQGAYFVDAETQLAHKSPNAAQGGRHPLPSPAQFAHTIGQLGIGPDSHVVVYDDKNGSNAAARFWWMLRALGHTRIQVLDGGFQAALAAKFPVKSGTETSIPTQDYPLADTWQLPTADINEVAQAVQQTNALVIDVRDAARYRGETEPIDLIAGHIPGAVNIPFVENLDKNGLYRSAEALEEKYLNALAGRKPADVVVHCGSGITACHTLLAMDYAGIEIPKLYVGSWSEWSRNDRPMFRL
jgi:thiosulfate/3-mercaptopyruvate sulfurtransferase